MTSENAKIRLLDSEQELSYSQRIAISDLIDSLKCCGNCKYCCEMGNNYLPSVRCMGLDQWESKEI